MPGITRIEKIAKRLSNDVDAIEFAPPVEYVYNPLSYAWKPHREYLRRYAREGIEALLLGMNPGPWGMAQTGVPFGEVGHVREFLGIEEPVGKPEREHPKRPIEGFACTRSEVSGRRLWGWVEERFGRPDPFFDRFFVWNDCPLAFLEDSGRNRTPDKLPKAEREALGAVCDRALRSIVKELKPQRLIGVGGHARKRLETIFGDEFEVSVILHPSPASPAANRGWAPQVDKQFAAMGIEFD